MGDRERLNCYYAHAEGTDGLQRRCYWILDSGKDDVVLVHYLCSSTSRAGGRLGPAPAGGSSGGGGSMNQRPQRAAAKRAVYSTARLGDYDDTDEDDEGSLPRDDSEGILVPVQLADEAGIRGGHRGRTQPAVAVGMQQHGSMRGSSGALMRDPSLIGGGSFLDKIPARPEWAQLPSLAQQYAAASQMEGRAGGHAAPGPGLLQFSEAQAKMAGLNGRQLPGSPSKSPTRRLVHDPLGSASLLAYFGGHADASNLMIDPLALGDTGKFFLPTRGSSVGDGDDDPATALPGGSQGLNGHIGTGGGSGDDFDALLMRGVSQLESLSGMLPSLPLQGSLGLEMDPESPGSKLLQTAGVTFHGRGNSLILAEEAEGGNGAAAERATGGSEDLFLPIHEETDAKVPVSPLPEWLVSPAKGEAAGERRPIPQPPVSQPPQKVETLRRIVAPSFRKREPSPSLADMAGHNGSSSRSLDGCAAEEGHHARRLNPVTAPTLPSHHDRIAMAAAHAAMDSAGRREEKLKELRLARQAGGLAGAGPAGGQGAVEQGGDSAHLIETPTTNQYFRIGSHLVSQQGAVEAAVKAADAEEATTLLKQMSIDNKQLGADGGKEETADATGLLLRNMSIDERGPAGEEEGGESEGGDPSSAFSDGVATLPESGGGGKAFGSEFGDPASRDPSLSSLLDVSLSMGLPPQGGAPSDSPAAPAVGGEGSSVDDQLKAAFELHASRRAAQAGSGKR